MVKTGISTSILANFLWNIYLFLVDYAIYYDAGANPQCCGGLRGGRLLWAECSCLTASSMVRTSNLHVTSWMRAVCLILFALGSSKTSDIRASKSLEAALNVETFIMGLRFNLGISLSAVWQYRIPHKNFETIHLYPENHVYLIAACAVRLSVQPCAARVMSLWFRIKVKPL